MKRRVLINEKVGYETLKCSQVTTRNTEHQVYFASSLKQRYTFSEFNDHSNIASSLHSEVMKIIDTI